MPEQFENARNFDGKTALQILMPKKCTCTLRIGQSRSKSVEKCSVFIILESSHSAVSKMCRLGFRFQNLPLPAKNVPFSFEREAYQSNFSPSSKCAGIV